MKHIDYSHMEGGLVRMMDRFKEEGTLTGDRDADDYIRQSPNAALLGLLYDQRVRAEYAFMGPQRLHEKLGHLDMKQIAAHDPDAFKVLFGEPPAVHRFTNKMADMTQAVAAIIADQYAGNAAGLWNDDAPFDVIRKRVQALPGFGAQKSEKMKYVLHYFGFRDLSE
ncbi:MAG: hypothetical protein R2834_05170 [Rhodothermales bacterium]